MRYSLIILALILLLTGCSGQKLYTSKGVTYFEKPTKELDTCQKFNLQVNPNATKSSFMPGIPIINNGVVYYPMQSSFVAGAKRSAFSAVYSYDLQTNSLKDSLLLNDATTSMSFKNIAVINDIFIVGIKDTLLHIIRTDASLKIKNEYPTNIRPHFIVYSGKYEDLLRIVDVGFNGEILMYDFNADDMQLIRKRLLAKNHFRYYQDGENLWFFSDSDINLTAVKINMAAYDPAPVYKTFDYAIPQIEGKRIYTTKASGDMIYLAHTIKTDENVTTSSLLSFNFSDGSKQSKDFTGTDIFDVASLNEKTYIFRAAKFNQQEALIVSELGADLQESLPLLRFYLADSHQAGRIITTQNSRLLLTGNYHQLPVGKKKSDKNVIPDNSEFKPFLAVTGAE
jgi:hypothetical protein